MLFIFKLCCCFDFFYAIELNTKPNRCTFVEYCFSTNFIDRTSMSTSIWYCWLREGRSRLPFSSWIVRSCVFGWNALPTDLGIHFRIICELVHILLDLHRHWSSNELVHICPGIASICHDHPNTPAVSPYPEMTFSNDLSATKIEAKFSSVNGWAFQLSAKEILNFSCSRFFFYLLTIYFA